MHTVTSFGFLRTALPLLGAVVFALAPISAGAQTEIHRCAQADGTVAFQETPCPEPETAPAEVASDVASQTATTPADEDVDFIDPFDAAPDGSQPSDADTRMPISQSRADCEQETRDAIDAIDLELQRDGAAAQRERYLERLLALTEQLRACKTL